MTNALQPGIRVSRKALAICTLAVAVIALLDGLVPQIEMMATGGRVPISTAILKAALLGCLTLAAAGQIRSPRISRFAALWLVTILYLAADSLYLSLVLHISILDILITYNGYYGYFLICPLAMFAANELCEGFVAGSLVAVFWFCFAIGTLQFLLARPLLYTSSADGNFVALSWYTADGKVRAFSLFTSGLGYGGLCCLAGSIGAGLLMFSRFKLRSLGLLACAAFGCYSTYTRNCYIQFLFAICAALCLGSKRYHRWVKYSPIVFLFLAVLLSWQGISSDTASGSAVTSNISVILRVAEWIYYASLYWAAPLVQKLLGLGIVQNARAATNAVIAIDNMYLGILLNIGLIGFALTFWLQWKMWLLLYRRAVEHPSALSVAFAGFWSTFLSVHYYNLSLAMFSLVFVMAVLGRPAVCAERTTTQRLTGWKKPARTSRTAGETSTTPRGIGKPIAAS